MLGKGQNKGIEEEAAIVYNAQHADVFMSGVFAGEQGHKPRKSSYSTLRGLASQSNKLSKESKEG